MGQYFKAVNLDKEQVVNPYDLDSGAKLIEIMATGNVGNVLVYLLREGVKDGGGDLSMVQEPADYEDESGDIDWNEWEGDIEDLTGYAGRWAGDDVRVIGDYNEDDLYDEAKDYEDITEDVKAELNRFLEVYGLEKIEEW